MSVSNEVLLDVQGLEKGLWRQSGSQRDAPHRSAEVK